MRLRVIALALLSGSALDAQSVRGRLLPPDGSTSGPPPGILVELVDSTDRVVRRVVSGQDGNFHLTAPRAGMYRVRALRIGFRPSRSAPIALGVGSEHALDLRLAGAAVVLSAVNVAEQRVCRLNPDSASQTAAAWEEALKVLALSEVTRAMRQYHMRVATFERRLDRGGRFLSQVQSERDGATVRPFKAEPADSLARHGYVTMDRTHTVYHGPDAEVLLSDAFARTHCLRLVVPTGGATNADWIGIGFEPIQRRRPDIQGVLWLDRRSNELREVEYRYVSLQPELEAAEPGGRVVFQRLPLGGWVVSSWWIRMPVAAVIQNSQRVNESRVEIRWLQETGGEVLTVSSGNERVWSGRTSGIRGHVVRPGEEPVAGIRVRLEHTNRRAVIDSNGRFAFDVLLPGEYTLLVDARDLEALGRPTLRVAVNVRDSVVTPVTVQVPSRAESITRICGEGTISDSLGLVRVVVTDSATRLPAGDVEVSGGWHRSFARHGEHLIATRTQRIGEQVNPGVFWLCSAPKAQLIDLQVRRGTRSITSQIHIPPDSIYLDHRISIGAP